MFLGSPMPTKCLIGLYDIFSYSLAINYVSAKMHFCCRKKNTSFYRVFLSNEFWKRSEIQSGSYLIPRLRWGMKFFISFKIHFLFAPLVTLWVKVEESNGEKRQEENHFGITDKVFNMNVILIFLDRFLHFVFRCKNPS